MDTAFVAYVLLLKSRLWEDVQTFYDFSSACYWIASKHTEDVTTVYTDKTKRVHLPLLSSVYHNILAIIYCHTIKGSLYSSLYYEEIMRSVQCMLIGMSYILASKQIRNGIF